MSNSIYYVYIHKHPVSEDVAYVGMGSKGRAWVMHNSGGDNAAYGHRDQYHFGWFLSLESEGYTLYDIVEIVEKGLTKKEALTIERALIADLNPTFNKAQGLNILKMDKGKYGEALELREAGLSYANIGLEIGLSAMTVYRALNGLTKNIGDDYGK
mgnify:CR=1 FL=1|jgi:hypothetical protein